MIEKNVENKIATYPTKVAEYYLQIRALVYDVVADHKLGTVEETLKWNEPAYLVKGGSTLRMDWRSSTPDHFYLFFNCKTILVETFKEVYPDVFEFEGNRAIRFNVNNLIPVDELKHCVLITLQYHKLKNLPLLGI